MTGPSAIPTWKLKMTSNLWTDLLYSLRSLRKAPGFTLVALGSLALGLGANTAIFSLIDQLMLRPLPVRDSSNLVLLSAPGPNVGSFRGDDSSFSYPMYRDIRDGNEVFSGVLARFPVPLNLQAGPRAESIRGELVSGNYFEVLGVGAALGRTLTPEDDIRKGEHRVAMISYDCWIRRFGGDRNLLGRDIRLNGQPMTVVGIAEPGFAGLEIARRSEVFLPMMMKAQITPTWDDLDNRRSMWLNMFARLKPGVTRERAFAAIQPMFKAVLEQEIKEMPFRVPARFVEKFRARRLEVLEGGTGVSGIRTEARGPLMILMAMVGLVLLIACANVANLLMARAASRQREIAIRLAMGATRGRILRQLLVESGVLSLLGGVAGLVVASWTLELIMNILPETVGRESLNITLDARVLGFSLLISITTGILFGLAPAIQATRPDLAPTLKDQATSVAGGWRHLRSRKALVIAQVSLSLLLLVGSGLFVRSLRNLQSLDPGFRTSNVISFQIDASLAGYKPEQIRQLYAEIESRLAAMPGVTGVTAADNGLLTGDINFATVAVQGYDAKPGENMNPGIKEVGPDFFKTMGVPLLYGREFLPTDVLGSSRVAIVNESFANYFFKGQSPLGRRFGVGHDNGSFEIVGVVGDSKQSSLREGKTRQFYLPWRQQERPGSLIYYVRTGFDADNAFAQVRREVANSAPGVAIYDMKTVERQVAESLTHERLVAVLCSIFGGLATLLAAIGLYGVMSFSVVRRTREIGIRVALGAGRRTVLRMVLWEVGALAAAGVVIGLPLSLGLSRLFQSRLFGLRPDDPMTLTAATALIVLVALVAGAIPALRAARVDPLTALRYE